MSQDFNLVYDIAAPPARVFAAWTEPKLVMAWWSIPGEFRTTGFDSDLRVGGNWRAEFTAEDGSVFGIEGIYRAISPPSRLDTSWKSSWDEYPTEVSMTFVAREAGTAIELKHSGFANQEDAAANKDGWFRSLERLKAYLERGA